MSSRKGVQTIRLAGLVAGIALKEPEFPRYHGEGEFGRGQGLEFAVGLEVFIWG